ncbi:MAG: DNA primase [Pelobacteraceae bacterium]
MIPEEKVREVAERVSIVEVVSDYVPLRRAGSNYLGLCPFHAEKTPSFNVNPAREIFHCFGCGAGGNAFSFVMKIEGVSFPEAVKLLARKSGIEIEERQLTPSEKKSQDEHVLFLRINDLTASYYRSILLNGQEGEPARQYLSNRSVEPDISEAYRLGFAPDRRDGLVKHLRNNGIELDSALKLGVVRKSDAGWYDLFRNRLIFPIRDARGQVIAFAGRVLDASLPKYINSPESPLYHKSSVLFGLDMALPSIRTGNSVIIVEGYFDHLALYRAGFQNVVATCGTALTGTHAGLIKRHAEKVYTLFDSDNAGKKATIRSMELFLEQRIPAYVVSLPSGDDPDSFLTKNSVELFLEQLHKAQPIFSFFIKSLIQATPPSSVNNKVTVIKQLAQSFKKIGTSAERSLYKTEISRLLDISVHELNRELQDSQSVRNNESPVHIQNTVTVSDKTQDMLLALMVNFSEARETIRTQRVETLFDGDYLGIVETVLSESVDTESPDWSFLLSHLKGEEQINIFSRILSSTNQFDDIDWRVAFNECKQKQIKKQMACKDIRLRLGVIDPNSEEYANLLKQADALIARKKSKL